MHRSRFLLATLLLSSVALVPCAHADGVPFVGVDLGVSEPLNDNYRANVHTGTLLSPFAGYMMNDYVGLQGQFHFLAQWPEDEGFCPGGVCPEDNDQVTTIAGLTMGPRFNLPLGKVDSGMGNLVTLYATGQGGAFKGMGGALNQWAPGMSLGGGVDFNLTEQLSVGLFGRWNRVYMAPHTPNTDLTVTNDSSDWGPKDARFATAGVGIKYSFVEPAAAPPPPPPPAPPPPPPAPPAVKKKIVLRSVHFDFNKSNIRADAKPVLDEAVRTLKDESGIAVISAGHTDSVGTDAYNMKLSQRRAKAVRDYLVDHGIAASRIKSEGFGESRPVASNDTADGRAQNRRVELNVQ